MTRIVTVGAAQTGPIMRAEAGGRHSPGAAARSRVFKRCVGEDASQKEATKHVVALALGHLRNAIPATQLDISCTRKCPTARKRSLVGK